MSGPSEWKSSGPTVEEALEFCTAGFSPSLFPGSYQKALQTLAAEVTRLRSPGSASCLTTGEQR